MLGVLTNIEITGLLSMQNLGRIACAGYTELYIVPVNYVFIDGDIYCRSYDGKKVEMMRNSAHVCFEVEDITDQLNWKCVVVHGIFEELRDLSQIDMIKEKLSEIELKKKAVISSLPPSEVSEEPMLFHGLPVYFRIRPYRATGRFEKAM